MKKLFVAAAILGMTSFAFGQQAASTSKDSKCSKACMKSCNGDKSCKKGSCAKDDKKASTASTTTTSKSNDKK